MAARFGTTESTGSSTSTSSTPGDKVLHTVVAPIASEEFIVFFCCDINVSNVATRCKVDLKVDGATIATFSPRNRDTTQWNNIFFFEQVLSKSANFDCEIEFSSTDNTNTVTIKNARIVVWNYTEYKSRLDLQYASDNTGRGLTAAYAAAATKTFTPVAAGNYLTFGAGGYSPGSATVNSIMRINSNGVFVPFASGTDEHASKLMESAVTDAFYNFNAARMLTLAEASAVHSIEAKNSSGTLGTWQHTRLLMFRADAFLSTVLTQQDTDTASVDTNATTTYETRGNISTPTPPVSMQHLILVNCELGCVVSTPEIEFPEARIRVATVEVQNTVFDTQDTTAPTQFLGLGHCSIRTDSVAFAVDTQHRIRGPLVDDESGLKNSSIVIIREDGVIVHSLATPRVSIMADVPGVVG